VLHLKRKKIHTVWRKQTKLLLILGCSKNKF
jgi:hypothetical protein